MERRRFLSTAALGVIAGSLGGCIDSRKFRFAKNQIVGCFGDSITAMDNGYVQMLQANYNEMHPDLGLRFLNYGKSSETVTGLTEKVHPGPRPYLFERLDTELEKETLNVALFCYGINCGIYGKPSQELFDSYKIGVYTFLEKMRKHQIKVILLTPPPLALDVIEKSDAPTNDEPYGYLNPYPKYDKEVLQEFKRIIMNMNHDTIVAKVDVHAPLSEKRGSCYDQDPIHPNSTGHDLMASSIMKNLSV